MCGSRRRALTSTVSATVYGTHSVRIPFLQRRVPPTVVQVSVPSGTSVRRSRVVRTWR